MRVVDSEASSENQDSLCMILAEEKIRHHDRELQTDPSSGTYNRTQHSTTGISPFMMLTGKERAMPLTFFYPEYEGKRTSPQAYVKEASRRQQIDQQKICMTGISERP